MSDLYLQDSSAPEAAVTSKAESASKTETRVLFFDVVRVFAILSVVVSHVAGLPREAFGSVSTANWFTGLVYHTLAIPDVTLLMMISGALLLKPSKQDEPVGEFLTKRLLRVGVPFLCWSLFYFIWVALLRGEPLSAQSFISKLATDNIMVHLWFMYTILGIYLATPILRIYANNAKRRDMIYFVIVWFIFSSLLPLFEVYIAINVVIFFPFVGYFLLGRFLQDVVLNRRQMIIALIVYVGVTLFSLAAEAASTLATQTSTKYFTSQTRPTAIIITVALYLIIKSLPIDQWLSRFPAVVKILRNFAAATFGIYLIHMFFVNVLFGIVFRTQTGVVRSLPVLITIPVFSIGLYVVSFLVVYGISKIPVLRAAV